MAISQYSSLSNSDLQNLYTSFNSFINRVGGSITQLTIPENNKKVSASDINNLNNKINEFRAEEYLKTQLSFWPTGSVTLNDIITASSVSNIITAQSKFSSVKCHNKANNNQGVYPKVCSTQGVHPKVCTQGYHTKNCGCHGQTSVACGANTEKNNGTYARKWSYVDCRSLQCADSPYIYRIPWHAEAYTSHNASACSDYDAYSNPNEGHTTNCSNYRNFDSCVIYGRIFSTSLDCSVTCPQGYHNNAQLCTNGGCVDAYCQYTQKTVDCGYGTYSKDCGNGACTPQGTTIDILCTDTVKNKSA